MTGNVLHTAVVPVNGKPVFERFLRSKFLVVVGVAVTQEVPARACPLGHCICFSACVLAALGAFAVYE